MENESFYLTLLSNSSFNHYPENKTSNFNVHLSKEINLKGEWCVALTEVCLPNTFFNVGAQGNKITVRLFIASNIEKNLYAPEGYRDYVIEIPIHHSDNFESLLKLVNTEFFAIFNSNLFENELTLSGRVRIEAKRENIVRQMIELSHSSSKIKISPREIHKSELYKERFPQIAIYLQGRLALQFGFAPDDNIMSFETSKHTPSLRFGLPLESFVYIDLIEPQLLSDVCSQVIKIIKTVDGKSVFGDTIHQEIVNRNYLPLCKLKFQTVSVQLRDTTGEFLPFSFGNSTIQLHFKKYNALQE